MDLRQLRHFVAVVEHGNMLRAADAINVTQPALSKSIRNLENRLGVQLLDRSPRGVSPTVYGRQLLDRAKLILNQAHKAEEDVRALVEGVRGHLNIGFGANFAGFMVPDAILKVVRDRPGVTASIISKPFDEIIPMLRQGALDVAVVVFPPERQDEDLVYEPLIVSEFVCVCRPAHPLAPHPSVPIKDVAELDWVVFDRPRATATVFEAQFLNRGLPPPKPVVQTSSVYMLKAILKQGDYLSYVPPGLVYEELVAGTLQALNVDFAPVRTTAGIVRRADDVLSAATIDVIKELRSLRDKLSASNAPFARAMAI